MTIHNEWDERYLSAPRLFSDSPDESLIECIREVKPGSALDLGAGEGRNSIYLASVNWDVTAVDFSKIALERLQESALSNGFQITIICSELLEFLSNAYTYDLIVIANIHLEPEVREKFFFEVSKALKIGGHLFIVGHHLDSLGKCGPPDPKKLYTEELLANGFPDLKILKLEKRTEADGDAGVPSSDLILWAEKVSA